MPRDPSPLDNRNHDPDSPHTHERFGDIDSRESGPCQSRASGAPRPPVAKHHDRLESHIPFIQGRTILYDRDRGYRITFTQARVLCDLAKFRIVAVHDLNEFVYRNRQERVVPELRNLVRQGLVRIAVFQGPEATPMELATLTRAGRRLVGANSLVTPEQATYSGLVKPKEANHDADLYRMYQAEAARIEGEGGEPLRVVLDYELKKNINREIARYGCLATPEIAARHALSVVQGKIPLPDLQIEYATRDGDVARVNLELVTEHYGARSVSQKVRAGFRLYTPHGETGRLRRVLDQHELTADARSL
jgi:hypothetical protein